MTPIEYFTRALNWAAMLDDPEPIWGRGIQANYLGFYGTATVTQLEQIVDFLNGYWVIVYSWRRCYWEAGEIRPYARGTKIWDAAGYCVGSRAENCGIGPLIIGVQTSDK